jgi:hypothetical protein
MKQKVEVVWKFKNFVRVGECYLLDDDSPVHDEDGDPLPTSDSEELKKEGFVMFEDDHGFFLMHASQIVRIQPLDQGRST